MSEPYDTKEPGYVSDCCGADVYWTDICSDCKEHCDPILEDEEN